MKRILVTGANGFVGQHLCQTLLQEGYSVRASIRSEITRKTLTQLECCEVGNIDAKTDWNVALKDVDIVVHLAARVHVMNDKSQDPLTEFRKVNVQGTEKLAKAAMKFGVKSFIYLSSIKVNGEMTVDKPFTENDVSNPQDPYAVSKLEAEEMLQDIDDLDVVILRPPLVYGPGVGANFLKLIQLVERNLPLPLASVKNRKSLVYVGNLVSAIIACLEHPKTVRQTFLVSDSESLSTSDLIRKIAMALKIKPKLFSFSSKLLKLLAKLIGKSDVAERLLGSLLIDSSKIQDELNWRPPYSTDEGLRQTIKWYLSKYE